jgi:hypothetical protein
MAMKLVDEKRVEWALLAVFAIGYVGGVISGIILVMRY